MCVCGTGAPLVACAARVCVALVMGCALPNMTHVLRFYGWPPHTATRLYRDGRTVKTGTACMCTKRALFARRSLAAIDRHLRKLDHSLPLAAEDGQRHVLVLWGSGGALGPDRLAGFDVFERPAALRVALASLPA